MEKRIALFGLLCKILQKLVHAKLMRTTVPYLCLCRAHHLRIWVVVFDISILESKSLQWSLISKELVFIAIGCATLNFYYPHSYISDWHMFFFQKYEFPIYVEKWTSANLQPETLHVPQFNMTVAYIHQEDILLPYSKTIWD